MMKWKKKSNIFKFKNLMKSIETYQTMISYKCRKNTKSKNPKVARTKTRRIMFLSKCAVCDSKRWKFIKEQEAS